jgi:hypothetical protein
MLRKHAGRMAGLAGALLLLVSLLSFHPQDPTLTNLRYPKDGIGNWAGYPGALIGGSAVEGLGIAALLLPLLVANAALFSRNRPAWHRYIIHVAALTLAASAGIGLAGQAPALGLYGPGLLGWAAGQWMRDTLGMWPGAGALAFTGLYSLAQVVYTPLLRRGFGDAHVLLRFGMTRLWGRAIAAWRQARPQTGWAWHERVLLPVHGAALATGWLWEWGNRRPLIRPLGEVVLGWRERRYSVARIKAASPAAMAPVTPPTMRKPPRFLPGSAVPTESAFQDWLDEPDGVTRVDHAITPTSAAPLLSAAAASPPASVHAESSVAPQVQGLSPPMEVPESASRPDRIARWEEYLRRYKENLDLHWDERAWKRKRLEELARDPGDAEAAMPPGAPK